MTRDELKPMTPKRLTAEIGELHIQLARIERKIDAFTAIVAPAPMVSEKTPPRAARPGIAPFYIGPKSGRKPSPGTMTLPQLINAAVTVMYDSGCPMTAAQIADSIDMLLDMPPIAKKDGASRIRLMLKRTPELFKREKWGYWSLTASTYATWESYLEETEIPGVA